MIELNRIESTPVFIRICIWQEMFSKQFATISHSKDLFFRGHIHAFSRGCFFPHFHVNSKTFSNLEWCGGWNNGVVGSWTTWFLDFNKRGAWNKRGGAKFGSLLINVLAEITELWVEKFQEINCRDVLFIPERRVCWFSIQWVASL